MKVNNTMLRYMSLPLGLVVTICLSQEVRADTFAVTSVSLAPAAVTIACNSSAEFTLTLRGTNLPSESHIAHNLLWSVYQDEPGLDDELIGETTFTVLGDPSGNWEHVITFTLQCTNDCILRGAGGSSGDRVAQVFALIEFPLGTDAGESNRVRVECATVPEPATMLLLGTGLAGVAAGVRRRRKSGKSEVT